MVSWVSLATKLQAEMTRMMSRFWCRCPATYLDSLSESVLIANMQAHAETYDRIDTPP